MQKARGTALESTAGNDASPNEAGDEQLSVTLAARSAKNIATWTAYLPEDCVKAMVKMGWDRDT